MNRHLLQDAIPLALGTKIERHAPAAPALRPVIGTPHLYTDAQGRMQYLPPRPEEPQPRPEEKQPATNQRLAVIDEMIVKPEEHGSTEVQQNHPEPGPRKRIFVGDFVIVTPAAKDDATWFHGMEFLIGKVCVVLCGPNAGRFSVRLLEPGLDPKERISLLIHESALARPGE